jgi:hypothetical protein
MKNIFFTLVLCLCFVPAMNAQTLAAFEDLAEDNLLLSDYGTSGDPYWYESSLFVDGGLPQVGNNPAVGGNNTSAKCLLAINVADADWWGNFAVLGMKTPITITESNRYLHVKVYRSIQPKDFRIGFNGREDANIVFSGTVANDATWENIVCDLGASFMDADLEYIYIIWSTNWSDPRTGWESATYAFDDFTLSDSPLPPDVTPVDGNGLKIGFESQSEITQWVQEFDLINADNTAEIIDNPFTTSAVNSAGKALQFNKSADASWWQGYRIVFNNVLSVGGDYPNYLHTLVYIPGSVLEDGMLGVDVQLCAKDHTGKENTALFTVWDDEVDEWIDLVMEINQIEYLKEVTVRYDLRKNENDEYINSPANTFYLDEIVFDKDENPRTEINTGINKPAAQPLAKVTATGEAIQIYTSKNAGIQVYNVVGQLIESAYTSGNRSIPVNKGLYIVKVASENGEKQITKLLVK